LHGFAFVEVTAHRIADLLVQLRDRVRLGEDRLAERSGGVAAFRRLFDQEYELRISFSHALLTDYGIASRRAPQRASGVQSQSVSAPQTAGNIEMCVQWRTSMGYSVVW
jgi:hypothetical protein